jgi:hypothetical protein
LEEHVFKNYLLTASLAVVASSTLVGAQAGATQQPPSRPAESQAAPQAATTTLTGCVYKEADVPGRAPNVAERAGILEDYILADATPVSSAAASAGTPGATGTSGVARKLYKLEFVDDDRLKALVGKRVEVVGRIDAEAGDARSAAGAPKPSDAEKVIGRDRIDIAELEVTSIKEVSGTCPAKPAAGR